MQPEGSKHLYYNAMQPEGSTHLYYNAMQPEGSTHPCNDDYNAIQPDTRESVALVQLYVASTLAWFTAAHLTHVSLSVLPTETRKKPAAQALTPLDAALRHVYLAESAAWGIAVQGTHVSDSAHVSALAL